MIKLMRIPQWVKNTFVFLPMFFHGKFIDPWSLLVVSMTFLAFCMASSAVYCLNDIIDVEADRKHPLKRLRPIASGQVSVTAAIALMSGLFGLSVAICLVTPSPWRITVLCLVVAYVILNILYCLKLKRHAIIDTFCIATGFVLRLVAGGIIAHIPLSQWIVMMTFLLALFLAFAKRRDDVLEYQATGNKTRSTVERYSLTFINMVMAIVSAISIVCYIMYTISPEVTQRLGSHYVYCTSVFVIAAVLRYHQLTIIDNLSGSPTRIILGDRFMQCCIGAWVLSFVVIIYARPLLSYLA